MRFSPLAASAAFLGLALLGSSAQATIIRVDNGANPAPYTTAQAAHDAATSGDTLYFAGSGNDYGNLNLSKKLTLVGPGHYLNLNPETQANIQPARLNVVTFSTGSGGSVMTGMTTLNYVNITTSNIVLKRNRINVNNNGDGIYIQAYVGNVILNGNYFNGYYNALTIYDYVSNIFVTNNIIYSQNNSVNMSTYSSAVFMNNTFDIGARYFRYSTVKNNVFLSNYTTSFAATVPHYNAFGYAATGLDSTNITGLSSAQLINSASASDAYYLPPAGSPIYGAGENGEDLGVFGGLNKTDRYVLSLLPAVPALWFFSAPVSGSAAQGLPVHIKAKAHN